MRVFFCRSCERAPIRIYDCAGDRGAVNAVIPSPTYPVRVNALVNRCRRVHTRTTRRAPLNSTSTAVNGGDNARTNRVCLQRRATNNSSSRCVDGWLRRQRRVQSEPAAALLITCRTIVRVDGCTKRGVPECRQSNCCYACAHATCTFRCAKLIGRRLTFIHSHTHTHI